ncbi:uncharacterized protein LOC143178991 [Calliopsis andreniformis]|uniref:uncharacterized protein LOC143178991 n=1 Tax=Calliopsis andreniformis TaxID=337506 RepID=UPI003FCD740C
MTGTITKLTVASYCVTPSRKAHTSSQTVNNDDAKVTKKPVESMESKASKVSIMKKKETEVQNQKKTLLPEKEKTKIIHDVKKEPLISVLKKPLEVPVEKKIDPTKKQLSEKRKSVQIITEKESVITPKESPTSNLKKALRVSESKIISPPQQVAEIISRLQEIEGQKTDGVTAIKQIQENVDKNAKTPSIEDGYDSITGIVTDSELILDDSTAAYRLEQPLGERSNIVKESPEKVDDLEVSKKGAKKSVSNDKEKVSDSKNMDDTKMERSLETSLVPQPQMGTQTAARNKKTHILRKNNKVEPIEVTHINTGAQTGKTETQDEVDAPTNKPQSEPGSGEDKTVNTCPSCQKQQVPPVLSPLRYYNVHKDKRGRLYCDFCATVNCIQVLYKNEEQKCLRCAGCGNFLRPRISMDEYAVKVTLHYYIKGLFNELKQFTIIVLVILVLSTFRVYERDLTIT